MLIRLLKILFVLIVIGGLSLIAFAYIGPIFMPAEFAAPSVEATQTLTLGLE